VNLKEAGGKAVKDEKRYLATSRLWERGNSRGKKERNQGIMAGEGWEKVVTNQLKKGHVAATRGVAFRKEVQAIYEGGLQGGVQDLLGTGGLNGENKGTAA